MDSRDLEQIRCLIARYDNGLLLWLMLFMSCTQCTTIAQIEDKLDALTPPQATQALGDK
jgi:hypothetical protein